MKTKDDALTTETLNETCFWELDLYTSQLHWSAELCRLLNFTEPYTPTLEQLIKCYEPEQNLRAAFNRAIHQGIPFELQIPVIIANEKVIMVYTIGQPIYDDYAKCIAVKGTLQTEMQQEIFTQTFATAAEKIERQQMMLNNFACIVSHNLRSHTSNLQIVLESAQQKIACREMQELINNIKTISSNLNQTVGYLNTLIKI